MERITNTEEINALAQEARELSSHILDKAGKLKPRHNLAKNKYLRRLQDFFNPELQVFDTEHDSNYRLLLRAAVREDLANLAPQMRIFAPANINDKSLPTEICLSLRDPVSLDNFELIHLELKTDKEDVWLQYPSLAPHMSFVEAMQSDNSVFLTDLVFPCLRAIDNILRLKEQNG